MEESTTKRYPPELKERAVRMVLDLRERDPHDKTVAARVAHQLGVGDELLRSCVKRSEVDAGTRPGLTSEEQDVQTADPEGSAVAMHCSGPRGPFD